MRVSVALMAFALIASTAAAQEPVAPIAVTAEGAGPGQAGRFDVSRLDTAGLLAEAQAPTAQRGAPQPPAPTPAPVKRRRGSMVGYVEDATIETKLRVRFDVASHNTVPDRAEFFYAKCGCYQDLAPTDPAFDADAPGPHPGAANDLNFQQLDVWGEYAVKPWISVFGQFPVRWLQPQSFIPGTGTGFPDQSGIGDIRAGARVALLATPEQTVTAQAQFFMPSGDAANGLGTDHASLEPMIQYFRQLSDIATLESQFGLWIPFGGAAGVPTSVDENFSGNVLNYGVGSGFDLVRKTGLRAGPVIELVGWHVLGGFQTAAVAEADGVNIVNLKIGGRVTLQERDSIYVGWGHHLTDSTWYDDIVRFEYRRSF